jgi:homoserine O-succinyltransferase/O-acetyltransferase
MPVIIADTLPAKKILESENISLINHYGSQQRDISPLQVAILNLMPTKIQTETQLIRLLANTPLQVDVTLLHPNSYTPRNTPVEHILNHYLPFHKVKGNKYDGLIITGAPVEHLPFEEVEYWEELKTILDWADQNVTSTFLICWAAQAGLYHRYGVPKYPLSEKVFGVFPHRILSQHNKLLRGFDDRFFAPHSRYTEIRREDLSKVPDVIILADSEEAGLYLLASDDGRFVYATGHSEYDPQTLKNEYERDLLNGLAIQKPKNYFLDNNPDLPPLVTWRGHANLLFGNWLNSCVFQQSCQDIQQDSLRNVFAPFG